MTYAPPGFISHADALVHLACRWFPDLVNEIERAEAELAQMEETSPPGCDLQELRAARAKALEELGLRTFTKLRDFLCLGRLHAFYPHIAGRGKEVPGFWETEEGGVALAQGYLPPAVFRPRVPFWFAVEEIEEVNSTDPLGRRGAKPKADWPALEEAFREEVRHRGMPNTLNEKDWRCQADVERWLSAKVEQEGDAASDSTIRSHARAFLKRARQEGAN
jgi:hypothetical protein